MRFDHTPFLIGHVRLVSVGLANMLLSQPLNLVRNGLLEAIFQHTQTPRFDPRRPITEYRLPS
jgi:hypothetical protein